MSKEKQPKDPAEQGKEIKTAADLIQDANNYRKHSETNKARIKKSIDEAGLGRSVVIDADGVLVAGNGVQQVVDPETPVRVIETDGTELVVVKRTDLHTGDPRRKTLALADNATSDNVEWDFEAIAEDWTEDEAGDWGVDWPEDEEEGVTDEEVIKRKEAEFKQRMEAGEDLSEDEEYQAFLEKFKMKKTTDDCYTPKIVYDAVVEWVEKEYQVSRKDFVRPFYPGGDYKAEKYPKGCIVVDNPPFSILAEILNFYKDNGVRFFLFAPTLTLFSYSSSSSALPCGATVVYENGASVNTSFLTNLEDRSIRFKSCQSLYQAVQVASDEYAKELHKELPRYSYPDYVVTAAFVARLSKYGIPFEVSVG